MTTANILHQICVEFRKELSADELVKLIIPLYDKHLTHPEIKELIKFYETEVGKKLISVMPAITAESMQAGQQWVCSFTPIQTKSPSQD